MQPERALSPGGAATRLERARALLGHLEAGNDAEAERLLDEWAGVRESELFRELGKLTRDLHEALNAFRLDARLADIAAVDIPDAKDRLRYVITMTEQSASRTLGAIETCRPLCDELRARGDALARDWQRFLRREMQAAEFRELTRRLAEFLPWVVEGAGRMKGDLSEVLMAQGFQDLTGQIIKRVIALVEEVERNLVNLIRLTGSKSGDAQAKAGALEGPQVPGRQSADAVSGQDEVDELLSSLGF